MSRKKGQGAERRRRARPNTREKDKKEKGGRGGAAAKERASEQKGRRDLLKRNAWELNHVAGSRGLVREISHCESTRTPANQPYVRVCASPGQDMGFCLIVRDIRSLIREEIQVSGKSKKG